LGITENIFHDTAPLHPGKHMLYRDTYARNKGIEERIFLGMFHACPLKPTPEVMAILRAA
jgi:hypothetical protein